MKERSEAGKVIVQLLVLGLAFAGCGDSEGSGGSGAGSGQGGAGAGVSTGAAGPGGGTANGGGPQGGGNSGGGAQGADPYRWYPALDMATIPFHAGSGPWGPQRAIAEAAEPVTSTAVTVTTCDELTSNMLLGGRTITVGADIDCNGAVVEGDVTDVDVILPTGRVLRSFVLGNYMAGHTTTRLRFRGETVGQHSGGQLHHVTWFAAPFDTIFDGIDCTGPGVIGGAQQAAILFNGPAGARAAFTNIRGAAGSYFFIGILSDLVVTGSSIMSGLEPRGPSGQEGWVFRVIGAPGASGNVFFQNDLRGTRYHKLRFHPNGTEGYAWVRDNVLVDMNEARILTVSQALVSDPKGYYAGFWAQGNEVWTDINDPPNAGPEFSSNSAAYVRFEGNAFHSDELTSDALLGISDVSEAEPESPPGFPNVPIPDASQDWAKSGNTFSGMQAEPAWKASTPGDPTTLSWDIGD